MILQSTKSMNYEQFTTSTSTTTNNQTEKKYVIINLAVACGLNPTFSLISKSKLMCMDDCIPFYLNQLNDTE